MPKVRFQALVFRRKDLGALISPNISGNVHLDDTLQPFGGMWLAKCECEEKLPQDLSSGLAKNPFTNCPTGFENESTIILRLVFGMFFLCFKMIQNLTYFLSWIHFFWENDTVLHIFGE